MPRRWPALLLALTALAPAWGYYHWTFLAGGRGAAEARLLKFDLEALPDRTVRFFIASAGPAKLVAGDNFTALASQIRRAGESWNVPQSALRIEFGGLTERDFSQALTEQRTPAIDIVFDDDLPPGVLALSEPQTYTDLSYLAPKDGKPGAPFAPILRSRLQLASDLAVRGQASYSDAFFLTLVHEFGHALGLQHSMTASAMATAVTRATSKARPLAADDIAGLALLYPAEGFAASTGAIAGRVTVEGAAANLASVVALGADGAAVGAMTLPDGSYRIAGLPPGEYRVYAHPLPPALPGEADPAGIVPPRDLDHAPVLATADFETRFYPGVTRWTEAAKILVKAGETRADVDFALRRRSGDGIFNLRMFAYLGPQRDQRVHAPPLPAGFRDWLAFTAAGVFEPGTATIRRGLRLEAIGTAANLEQNTLRNFPGAEQFLLVVASAGPVPRATPVAVAVSTDTDLYVLPTAFTVTPTPHPLLSSVGEPQWVDGRWQARLTGQNLESVERVLFDGVDAVEWTRLEDGALTAVAPPAPSEHAAAITLLGRDGQSSWQLRSEAPPLRFLYPKAAAPFFTLTPGDAVAGTDLMLEFAGSRTAFTQAVTTVGFDTSDVAVRQKWVTGDQRLVLNVSVRPQAKLGPVRVTVTTGLLMLTDGLALQLRPSAERQSSLRAPLLNAATGLAGVPAGAEVAIATYGAPLPDAIEGWAVLIGGLRGELRRASDGRLTAIVPPRLSGPQPLQVVGESGRFIPPVAVQVDGPPPRVITVAGLVSSAPGAPSQSLRVGEEVTMVVERLREDTPWNAQADIEVRIGDVPQTILGVQTDAQTGRSEVRLLLVEATELGPSRPLVVRSGTRLSEPFFIGLAAALPKP
jgi:hypothetical protein